MIVSKTDSGKFAFGWNVSRLNALGQVDKDETALNSLLSQMEAGSVRKESVFAATMRDASEAAKELGKSVDLTSDDINAFVVSQKAAIKSSNVFAVAGKAVVASLKSIGMALLHMAAVTGVMLLVQKGMEAISNYVNKADILRDKINTLDDEYANLQSSISELNDEMETTGKRISELEAKPKLTFVEENELENMRELLRLMSIKLDAEKEAAKQNERNSAKTASDLFATWKRDKNLAEYNMAANAMPEELTKGRHPLSAIRSLDDIESQIKSASDVELIDKLEAEKERLKGYLNDQRIELMEMYEPLLALDDDMRTTSQKEDMSDILELIDTIQKTLEPEQWAKDMVDRVFSDKDLKPLQSRLEDMAESGRLSLESIANTDFSPLLAEFEKVGLGAIDVVDYFNKAYEAAIENAGGESAPSVLSDRFKRELDNYASALELLSSQEVGGLSSEAYNELIKLNANYASAIDTTTGSIRLNADALRALHDAEMAEIAQMGSTGKQDKIKEYQAVTTSIETNIALIEDLVKISDDELAAKDLTVESRKEYIDILEKENDNLLANRNQIKEAIGVYDRLASEIQYATSAYKKWLDAKNAPEDSDAYEGMRDVFESLTEGLESGKTGTKIFAAAAEALIPDDVDLTNAKAVLDYYKYLEKYLREGEEGLNNFVRAMEKSGISEKTSDGLFKFAEGVSVESIAKELHFTEEYVRAMLNALNDYGQNEIVISGMDTTEMLSDLEAAQAEVIAKEKRFNELKSQPVRNTIEEEIAYQNELTVATQELAQAQAELNDLTSSAEPEKALSPIEQTIADLQTSYDTLCQMLEKAAALELPSKFNLDITQEMTRVQGELDALEEAQALVAKCIVTGDTDALVTEISKLNRDENGNPIAIKTPVDLLITNLYTAALNAIRSDKGEIEQPANYSVGINDKASSKITAIQIDASTDQTFDLGVNTDPATEAVDQFIAEQSGKTISVNIESKGDKLYWANKLWELEGRAGSQEDKASLESEIKNYYDVFKEYADEMPEINRQFGTLLERLATPLPDPTPPVNPEPTPSPSPTPSRKSEVADDIHDSIEDAPPIQIEIDTTSAEEDLDALDESIGEKRELPVEISKDDLLRVKTLVSLLGIAAKLYEDGSNMTEQEYLDFTNPRIQELEDLIAKIKLALSETDNLSDKSIGDLSLSDTLLAAENTLTTLIELDKQKISDKSFDINARYKTIGAISGDSHASGTKNARGGLSVVAEPGYGPEAVIDPVSGKYAIYSQPAAVSLPPGAIVLNKKETEKMLSQRPDVSGSAHGNGLLSKIKEKLSQSAQAVSGFFSFAQPASLKSSSKKKSTSKSGGSSSSSFDDLFDWIEIRLEELSKQTAKLIDQSERLVDFKARNDKLSDALASTADHLSQSQVAYTKYMAQADAIAKKTKLSADIIAKIQDGSLEISSYKKNVQESIQEYQKWYDKATEVKDAIVEIKDQQREIAATKLDNIVEQYDNLLDRIEGRSELAESMIDLKNALGERIYSSDYQAMTSAGAESIATLTEAHKALSIELANLVAGGLIDEGSDAWHGYMSKIEDFDKSIVNAKKDLRELEDTVASITINELKYGLKELEATQASIESIMALQKTQQNENVPADYERLIDTAYQQIKNIEAQNAALRKQMVGLDRLSEKYSDISSELAQNEQTILNIKSAQEEWNDSIIEIQIAGLEQQQSELQKTNDLYQRQLTLQQAIEDVEKAKQRRVRIYREGAGYGYEVDQTALRSAQDALDQVRHDEMISTIDDAIEALRDLQKSDNIYDRYGIPQYASGGKNTRPGLAMLHGTESDPEWIFNSDQMRELQNAINKSNMLAQTVFGQSSSLAYTPARMSGDSSPASLAFTGDIHVHEVNDGDQFAKKIVNELPSAMWQEIYKRK